MKALSIILAALIVSASSFAGNSPLLVGTESHVAVVKSYNKIKLCYESDVISTVKVKIFDERGRLIYDFRVYKTDGFIQPINVAGLENGVYTFEIEDANGTIIEKVDYNREELSKLKTSFFKLRDQEKYKLQVESRTGVPVNVKVFDKNGNLLHEDSQMESFSRAYDLSKVEGEVTFLVNSDIYTKFHTVKKK
ncbi:MAG: T9SS type A sorting domain-containing protein [Cyclobacteriaceae bacterium]|nr:T9SS type A sorting domain-containing protein [Cyclobacteriaceae bacterium]